MIVIGAGHAGCEAALACARKGHKTLLTSISLDGIAFLACNPSIGGTAKGQLVREVDALGGEMGLVADETMLQLRMLNKGKGAAVQSLRAQTDKYMYHLCMKRRLENAPNLELAGMEVTEILVKGGKVFGVKNVYGETLLCKAAVLACGVYLDSDITIGEYRAKSGPSGFARASYLSKSLSGLGLKLRRFKTGTPARADRRTIDFSVMEKQEGDSGIYSFSFLNKPQDREQAPCYLTYTTQKTHDIIRANLHRAPMYSGTIKGRGPRYCPSIEDKVVRFADKERHQVFIEPEGAMTNEVYLQGASTSLPVDVQLEMYRSIKGLENVRLTRYAYAIEYDCIDSLQLDPTLRYKEIEGLYFAGQINGTSGYEEAAAQGIVAGINAALWLEGRPPFILGRHEAYIGVLIDDLVTKGSDEPYRMMTSRAEHRIRLRQDNADVRLTPKGREAGLVDDIRWEAYCRRMEDTEKAMRLCESTLSGQPLKELLEEKGEPAVSSGIKLSQLLKRPQIEISDIERHFGIFEGIDRYILDYVQNEIKYEGYLLKEDQQIERMERYENREIPSGLDYMKMEGLRIEARQKLATVNPRTIGQASRISGVSPADIAVLIMYITGRGKKA